MEVVVLVVKVNRREYRDLIEGELLEVLSEVDHFLYAFFVHYLEGIVVNKLEPIDHLVSVFNLSVAHDALRDFIKLLARNEVLDDEDFLFFTDVEGKREVLGKEGQLFEAANETHREVFDFSDELPSDLSSTLFRLCFSSVQ